MSQRHHVEVLVPIESRSGRILKDFVSCSFDDMVESFRTKKRLSLVQSMLTGELRVLHAQIVYQR